MRERLCDTEFGGAIDEFLGEFARFVIAVIKEIGGKDRSVCEPGETFDDFRIGPDLGTDQRRVYALATEFFKNPDCGSVIVATPM